MRKSTACSAKTSTSLSWRASWAATTNTMKLALISAAGKGFMKPGGDAKINTQCRLSYSMSLRLCACNRLIDDEQQPSRITVRLQSLCCEATRPFQRGTLHRHCLAGESVHRNCGG